MFHNQENRESKSIWDPKDNMPAISEITSLSLHGSQIAPQYPPNNHQMQQYRQAWTIEGSHDNEITNPKK